MQKAMRFLPDTCFYQRLMVSGIALSSLAMYISWVVSV